MKWEKNNIFPLNSNSGFSQNVTPDTEEMKYPSTCVHFFLLEYAYRFPKVHN